MCGGVGVRVSKGARVSESVGVPVYAYMVEWVRGSMSQRVCIDVGVWVYMSLRVCICVGV